MSWIAKQKGTKRYLCLDSYAHRLVVTDKIKFGVEPYEATSKEDLLDLLDKSIYKVDAFELIDQNTSNESITEDVYNDNIYDVDDNGIEPGDYVKVVAGRKIPIGTIAKVVTLRDEEYGPVGGYNYTVYAYLDIGGRTNVKNCVKATPEEIAASGYKKEKRYAVGQTVELTVTIEKSKDPDKPYYAYKFTTNDGEEFFAFLVKDIVATKGTIRATIKSLRIYKTGRQIVLQNISFI